MKEWQVTHAHYKYKHTIWDESEWGVSEVKVIVVEYPDETKCMEKNEFLLPGNTKLDRRESGDVL